MKNLFDVIIIGAGASGLLCAEEIIKRKPSANIAIIDANPKAGRKLLATGNGRCNFSNENVVLGHYHGDVEMLGDFFSTYNADFVKNLFEKMGIIPFADSEGRLYPYSRQAASVLSALMCEIEDKVTFIYASPVNKICYQNKLYSVYSGDEVYSSQKLVIAAGGKASPKLSSTNDAYKLASSLNLKITELFPALCPLIVNAKEIKSISGIRARSNISLLVNSKKIYSEQGEIQFTDKAVSGIAVFNLSAVLADLLLNNKLNIKKDNIEVTADLTPDISFNELKEHFEHFRKSSPSCKIFQMLSGVLNSKLVVYILKKLNMNSELTVSKLSPNDIKNIVAVIKKLSFKVTALGDFADAQVTAGGVKLSDVNTNTFESKKNKGLYVLGELLNIYGDCGGYNLHFAWASGYAAAHDISEKI